MEPEGSWRPVLATGGCGQLWGQAAGGAVVLAAAPAEVG